MGAARGVIGRIAQVLQVIGQIVLAFMVVTICYDATMRYAFAAPTSWSLEVNGFLIVYLAVMTAADVQRTDAHIRITFVTDRLGGAARGVVRTVIALVGVAFSGIMAWRGALLTAQAWEYGERVSSGFGTPMVLPYAMLPIGFGVLGLIFLLNLFGAWTDEGLTERENLENV